MRQKSPITQKLSEKTSIPGSTLPTWRFNLPRDYGWLPIGYRSARARRALIAEQEKRILRKPPPHFHHRLLSLELLLSFFLSSVFFWPSFLLL